MPEKCFGGATVQQDSGAEAETETETETEAGQCLKF